MTVRVSFLFVLYLAAAAVLSSWVNAACAAAALILHEAVHVAAATILKERISRITLSPFGGVIEFDTERCPRKGVVGAVIALSGPAANYLMIQLICALQNHAALSAAWGKGLLLANLSMLLLNLYPALPLDGGRAAFSIGYCFIRISLLASLLSISGIALGSSLIAIGIYAAKSIGTANVSLFIVGAHLIYSAARSKAALLQESRLAVLQERKDSVNKAHRIRIYRVMPETSAIHLLSDLHEHAYTLYYIDTRDSQPVILSETQMVSALLENPFCTMSEVITPKEPTVLTKIY